MPTLPYDYPSISSLHQTPTLGRRHKSSVNNEVTSRQLLRIAHQKVNLDVDLSNQSIVGETEITVLPLDAKLKKVKLDCRNVNIQEVFVNNQRVNYKYTDFNQNNEFFINHHDVESINTDDNMSGFKYNPFHDITSKSLTVNQHHFYKGKFHPLFANTNHLSGLNINTDPAIASQNPQYTPLLLTNTEELVIYLPENLKLKAQDVNELNFSPSKSNHNTPHSMGIFQEQVYTSISIKINYEIKNPKNGILFNGGLQTQIPKDKWFCHTINNDFGCSASSWVPCIDNLYEKATWDITLSFPKTVGDIGESKIIGTKAAEIALKKQQRNQDDDDENEEEEEDVDNEDGDEGHKTQENVGIDWRRELVVASPEMLNYKEFPHPIDLSKKVVSFQIYNPIAPQHLGFAIGPFEKWPLINLTENPTSYEEETNNISNSANTVPFTIYHLPNRKDEVLNTCIFLYKALDFYSKEFGSFPFNSFSMIFLENLSSDSCSFAGLSIINDNFLYSANKIEPIFSVTEFLAENFAQQWSGINVLPKTHNDFWCVIGISQFMASQFLKTLFGVNEYKYRNKQKCDLICEQDIGKRPLANQFFEFPINDSTDFQFLKLKSSLVLFILDRRMTKTDKSFGLSRVIPKIFLQAMSNDLFAGNCLSTHHFKHVCEKVNHNRLDNFFSNWVYSSGTPVFRVTQRFNKKRMIIEMGIRQVQVQELNHRNEDGMITANIGNESRHGDDNFVSDAMNYIENDDSDFNVPAVFQGPMTIRIHEADGTPYEHIVDLKEGFTKLDIQYNTKYRRFRRGKRKAQDDANNFDDEEEEMITHQRQQLQVQETEEKVNRLGDVLISPEEITEWNLQEWTKEDEENQANEAFEWVRIDADFEWICKIHMNQSDYMFQSQLQQDRDVEAQIDSVRFFSNAIKPSSLYSSILVRTLMDERYFYGVRLEAAMGLAKFAKEEVGFIGMKHLLKAFHELYCFKTNYIPLPNDFSNFTKFFVLKIIPKALSSIKLSNGESPIEIRKILLNLLKYNDNLNNQFEDCFYIAIIIQSLFTAIQNSGGFLIDRETGDKEVVNFLQEANDEISRILKLDKYLPSYHNIITLAILKEKIKLARLGLCKLSHKELIAYTNPALGADIRLLAFEGLLILGGLKNTPILNYFFTVAKLDKSPRIKSGLFNILAKVISVAAIHGTPSVLDDEEFEQVYHQQEVDNNTTEGNGGSGVIFIEDGSNKNELNSRRDAFARATISGAIEILRRDYSFGTTLRKQIWDSLHSCLIDIHSKRNLFDICDILYVPKDSFTITLESIPSDRKIVAKIGKVNIEDESVLNDDNNSHNNINEEEGKVPSQKKVFEIILKRQSRLKIQVPKLIINDSNVKKEKKQAISIKIPSHSRKNSSVKEEVPTTQSIPKLKLDLKARASAAPVLPPVNLKIKTPNTGTATSKAPSATPSATPSVPPVTSKAKGKSKLNMNSNVVLKFQKQSSLTRLKEWNSKLPKIINSEIIRSSKNAPLRYVRIINNSNHKKLILSSDQFQEISEPVQLKSKNSSDSSSLVTVDRKMSSTKPSIQIKIKTKKSDQTLKKSSKTEAPSKNLANGIQASTNPKLLPEILNDKKTEDGEISPLNNTDPVPSPSSHLLLPPSSDPTTKERHKKSPSPLTTVGASNETEDIKDTDNNKKEESSSGVSPSLPPPLPSPPLPAQQQQQQQQQQQNKTLKLKINLGNRKP
ncbi:hypothetical protein PACTADRAFT_63704 [Pachysolen tannophilus NRRL Y-2460]|uniref:Transcription initiation factor TFIID subunit 2 n=1 Tax=Pachysolen tannophilus NRRL Y-2460 TaxID=669874 RepID=A0A1E4U1Z8_PACTA|nr:hypothetical protein PACTADRAFT_63704 [Pachysolen tannophilus NRRL Y-2460]